jgi:lipopolysaccharide assembly outer membrane protein LptD (OstA)
MRSATRQPHDISIAPQSVRSLGLLWSVQMMKAFARVVLPISLAAGFGLFAHLSFAQDQNFVFYQDPATPVTIQADRLSVSNHNRTATFSGNVVVTRGAVRMECARAVVHYHSERSGRRGVIDRFECKQDYLHLVD